MSIDLSHNDGLSVTVCRFNCIMSAYQYDIVVCAILKIA